MLLQQDLGTLKSYVMSFKLMMQFLSDNFFSNKYANKAAIENNCLQEFLYRSAFFSSKVFVKLGVSANLITSFSLALTIFSMISFLFEWWNLFIISWLIALHLDYCDGTVARMTKTTSKFAFRYDHFSDICKIAMIILGVSIHLNSSIVWILAFCFMFFYEFSEILHHDLASNAKARNLLANHSIQQIEVQQVVSRVRIREKYFLVGFLMKYFPSAKKIFDLLVKQMNSIFMNFNGHTLLLFPLFALGINYTIGLLTYLLVLSIKHSFSAGNQLMMSPKL